jgi:hypothetical protein
MNHFTLTSDEMTRINSLLNDSGIDEYSFDNMDIVSHDCNPKDYPKSEKKGCNVISQQQKS